MWLTNNILKAVKLNIGAFIIFNRVLGGAISLKPETLNPNPKP